MPDNQPELPRVTVWNEYRHEKTDQKVARVYPEGIHNAIGQMLEAHGFPVRTATLDEPEHGLTDEILQQTDVLIWWGHMAHEEVRDEIVDRLQQRILNGMGLIALHSSHISKIFKRMIGASGRLTWRDIGEMERLWVVSPSHPITRGLGMYFEIPQEEMYGEYFDNPAPDELARISWFPGGEVFRSGCCFRRGLGKIFYFRPGPETYPTYYQPEVQQVIRNAAAWAAPGGLSGLTFIHRPEPLENSIKT